MRISTKYFPLIVATFAFSFLLSSCKKNLYVSDQPSKDTTLTKNWRFIGEAILPNNLSFNATSVGGLSGIDYDSTNDLYYIISDDRSEKEPARFYTAKLYFNTNSFDSVKINGVHFLKQQDGSLFPNKTQDETKVPDPESIRLLNNTQTLLWTSEGERKVTAKGDTILIDPFLREMNKDGSFIKDYPIPAIYKMYKTEYGMRQNGSLEGVTLSPDEKFIYISNEEPLYQDGPRADIKESNSFIRITKINRTTQEIVAQYAYKLDKVHAAPIIPTDFRVNGVDEILAISETKLYVMERSFAVGANPSNSIRIYEIDLNGTTNVGTIDALNGKTFTPVSKKLVIDLAVLPTSIDNVEGITFGPKLPNGHKTIVLVSDNNFASYQKTQFLVFEVK